MFPAHKNQILLPAFLPFHMHVWETSVDGTVIRQTQHLEIHVLDLSASLIKQTAATKWGADACWAAAAACLQAGHGRKFTKGHAGYYIYI